MTTTEDLQFTVNVNHEDDGSLWAEVIELPGCFASGDSLDELWEALSEAISLYLTDDPDGGKVTNKRVVSDVPRPMSVEGMRVKVPA